MKIRNEALDFANAVFLEREKEEWRLYRKTLFREVLKAAQATIVIASMFILLVAYLG